MWPLQTQSKVPHTVLGSSVRQPVMQVRGGASAFEANFFDAGRSSLQAPAGWRLSGPPCDPSLRFGQSSSKSHKHSGKVLLRCTVCNSEPSVRSSSTCSKLCSRSHRKAILRFSRPTYQHGPARGCFEARIFGHVTFFRRSKIRAAYMRLSKAPEADASSGADIRRWIVAHMPP